MLLPAGLQIIWMSMSLLVNMDMISYGVSLRTNSVKILLLYQFKFIEFSN